MGYYTDFIIQIVKQQENVKLLVEDYLQNILGSDFFLDNSFNMKWYNFEEEMKTLSLKFPDVLFKVDGNGEENGDIWRSYFCNGHMITSTATLVFKFSDGFTEESFYSSNRANVKYKASVQDYISALEIIDTFNKERGINKN